MSVAIQGYQVAPLLRSTGREILEDGVPALAAQTAYYFFFSLFPILLFGMPLIGLIADERAVLSFVQSELAATVGAEAFIPIRAAIESVVFSEAAPGLMSTGALLAAWSGSNVFGALMAALNTAYDVVETRPWWKRLFLRLAMFLVAVVTVLGATLVFLGGEDIARWAGSLLGVGESGTRLWNLVQFPLAFLLLVLVTFLVFYVLPNVRQDWRPTLVAALVTTALWVIATLLFRLYVQNFAGFNKTYGTIGGVIALLTWMYYTMFVVISGGELASELAHGTAAVRPAKGVIYHGRIVSSAGPSESSVEKP